MTFADDGLMFDYEASHVNVEEFVLEAWARGEMDIGQVVRERAE